MKHILKEIKEKVSKITIFNIISLILIGLVIIAFQFFIGYGKLFQNIFIQLLIMNIVYILFYIYVKPLRNGNILKSLKTLILIYNILMFFEVYILTNQVNILFKSEPYDYQQIIHHTATDLGNRFETAKDSEGKHLGFVIDRKKLVKVEYSTDFKIWKDLESAD